YSATLDTRYLDLARMLTQVVLDRFVDKQNGAFFFTSDDHEELITRSKAAFDGSTPSGNSAAVVTVLRLHRRIGEDRNTIRAERTLKLVGEVIEKQPFGCSHMLEALDLYLRGPTEVVLAGTRDSADFHEWFERMGLLYVPNLALFATDGREGFGPEPARDKR